MVEYWYGEFGVTRLFGALFAGGGIYMAFAKEIPLYLGSALVGRVSGWSKAWVVIPVIAIGICMIVWAPEITCFSTRYKHLCA
jgi:hypothetical protein